MLLLEFVQGPSIRRVKNLFENNERPGNIMEKNIAQSDRQLVSTTLVVL